MRMSDPIYEQALLDAELGALVREFLETPDHRIGRADPLDGLKNLYIGTSEYYLEVDDFDELRVELRKRLKEENG